MTGKSLVRISLFFLLCGILFVAGCGPTLVKPNSQMAQQELANLPRIAEDCEDVRITECDNSDRVFVNFANTRMHGSEPTVLQYNNFAYNWMGLIVVQGKLSNGKSYNMLLDTGSDDSVIINGLTARENSLEVYPVNYDPKAGAYYGLARLPKIELGDIRVDNPPTKYLQMQWEFRILGLPLWRQRGALIGTELLKEFSYVKFDNIGRRATLAPEGEFVPDNRDKWRQYSMSTANNILKVDMQIQGHDLPINFDSCGVYPVVLPQELWEKIEPELDVVSNNKSSVISGVFGSQPCRKATVRRLQLGDSTIRNAEITIMPEGNHWISQGIGYISMAYFRDTVVVLDFENNLFWVRDS